MVTSLDLLGCSQPDVLAYDANYGDMHSDRFVRVETTDPWWSQQVLFVELREVTEKGQETETTRYYGLFQPGHGMRFLRMERMSLLRPPDFVLKDWLQGSITAFTEYRQRFWSFQPSSWLTYHNFTILEVNGGALHILMERVSDQLEIMVGSGSGSTPEQSSVVSNFMQEYRSTGQLRNLARCYAEPKTVLRSKVTLQQLLRWLDGPVRSRWVPYSLLQSNCQHFQAELHQFLLSHVDPNERHLLPMATTPALALQDPRQILDTVRTDPRAFQLASKELQQDRNFILAAIEQNWRALAYAPDAFQHDQRLVLACVHQDGNALQNMPEKLRYDLEVVMTAVRQNGEALQFAGQPLKANPQVVLAAVEQKTSAFEHADPSLRASRDLVLRMLQMDGLLLRCIPEHLRRDRRLVLEAVRQNGAALQYVASELRRDLEVVLQAASSDPLSLLHAF
eukprot:TRINITY_DN9829_c1_g1_i1.p1 TRINITY_DN9829_c1_g1~~TRINITY_DN9829_c1_g1_i1.p1  ORF type:complete len:451 (-),score=79.75 TRINITY_DN9829_c1_g1_i1:48-1400(-)